MALDPTYRLRLIEPVLSELAEELSALMLVGPRAVGKTTTVERCKRSSKTAAPGGRVVIIENGST